MVRPAAVALACLVLLAGASLALAAIKRGTDGPDRLRGTPQRDLISGRAGADRLVGRGAADRLRGGKGRDVVRGGMGHDVMRGGKGHDVLRGGKGRDGFEMRRGRALPAPGSDRILARDGRPDEINCGAGKDDIALVDAVEDGVYDCEKVVEP